MTSANDIVVDVSGLTKFYPGLDRPAVQDFTLQLSKGEIFGFVGPNGAGKTTTIKMLLNLAWPDSGGGKIFGLDIIRDSVAIRRRVGFMSGEVHLWKAMRGRELLNFILSLHGGGEKKRIHELCERFEVPLNRKIKTYSSGQKQMLAMIAALAHSSELLVLDEPTKGLDPSKKMQFLDLIEEWRQGGGAVIISSHVLSEIEQICTRVGFIREGVLVGHEEVESARKNLSDIIIATFSEPIMEEKLRLDGVGNIRRRGEEYVLHLDGDGKQVLRELTYLPLESLRYRAATLDDLYEGLYLNEDDK